MLFWRFIKHIMCGLFLLLLEFTVNMTIHQVNRDAPTDRIPHEQGHSTKA